MINWIVGAVIIAAVSAGVLLLFFRRQVTWVEFPLLIPVPIIGCLIGSCASETWMTRDTQYVTGWITQVQYDEPWDETVRVVRHRVVRVGKTTTLVPYVVFERRYHGPQWRAIDERGIHWSITAGEFERYCARFGSRAFVELHRKFRSLDGDRYVSIYDGSDEKLASCRWAVSYENRTQANTTLFRFPEITKTPYKLFQERKGGLEPDHLYGPATLEETHAFEVLNARLGKCNCEVQGLIFVDQPMEAALHQEALWKGGKFNALVCCVGVSGRAVKWVYVFGWPPCETLKVKLRQLLTDQTQLSWTKFAADAKDLIPASWQARNPADFAYVPVEPPSGWLVFGMLCVAAIQVAICFYLITNDLHEGTEGEGEWLRKFFSWSAYRS